MFLQKIKNIFKKPQLEDVNSWKIVDMYSVNEEMQKELIFNCKEGNLLEIKELIKNYKEVVEFRLGINAAARFGQLDVVEYLLNCKSLPKEQQVKIQKRLSDGFHAACESNQLEIIKYYLEKTDIKNQPSAISKGFKQAAEHNNVEVLDFFVVTYGLKNIENAQNIIDNNDYLKRLVQKNELNKELKVSLSNKPNITRAKPKL